MKDEILGLPEEENLALAALHDTARERQKQKFLEGFFIDVASIPALALRVKRRYGLWVSKQRHVTRRGVKASERVWRPSDPRGYRLESEL